MPSDVTQDVAPQEVAPVCGQRGPRNMAVVRGYHLRKVRPSSIPTPISEASVKNPHF